MKTLKVSELTQEQHEEDIELTLLSPQDRRVLDEVTALSDAQLSWYRSSGAFWRLCQAEIARRKS